MDGPPETKSPPTVAAVGGQDSSSLGRRLNRYGNAKRHTGNVMADIGPERALSLGLPYKRVVECGDWMRFRDYYTIGEVKLAGANFCKKHLVCSLCAIRRASRTMASYLERFEAIRKDRPGIRPYLATTTIRNRDDLGEGLEHLTSSLRLFHRRRNNKRQPSLMHGVLGGVYSIELTQSDATGWHPHAHAIWLTTDDAMEDATMRLRREWEQITGDSFMCDVRPIEAQHDLPPDIDPHAGGFAEVFKYAMKPSELGAEKLVHAYPYLAGKRLIGSFGLFRGVPEATDLADDLSECDGLPYVEFLARYVAGVYHRQENRNAQAHS